MYAKVYHWFESNILCHVLLLWEIEANVETPISSKLRVSHLRMRRLGAQPEFPIGNGLLVRIRNIYVDGYFYSKNKTMGALSTVTPAKVSCLAGWAEARCSPERWPSGRYSESLPLPLITSSAAANTLYHRNQSCLKWQAFTLSVPQGGLGHYLSALLGNVVVQLHRNHQTMAPW